MSLFQNLFHESEPRVHPNLECAEGMTQFSSLHLGASLGSSYRTSQIALYESVHVEGGAVPGQARLAILLGS